MTTYAISTHARRQLVLLSALSLSGCFSATVSPAGRPCESDDECGGGAYYCDPEANVCVVGEGTSDEGGATGGDGDTGDGDGDGTTGDGTTGDGTTGDGTTGDGDGATGDGDGTTGDGDGATGDGDGTGDGTTGDGTTGDGTTGDGDGTTGDGDGTTGDGTTGDGDGTSGDGTTGDGDGTSGDGDGSSGDGTTGDGTSGDGDGTTGDGDGTTGDGTTGDGDGATGDGDGATGDGDGSTGDGDGDGDGTALFPARGIDITLVEANQGVGVYIGNGDTWISSASRLARLIGGRETMIRIHHAVHGDWIPREIEAQLEIQRQDLTVVTYTDRRTIFMDSIDADLSSSFAFELDCSLGDCEAGTDYQVTFWDVGTPGPQSPGINANPAGANAPVGFEALDLELRLVFVPLEYVPLGTTPDLNSAWMDGIADSIYQMTPTTAVTYEVRPSEQVTQTITTDLSPAWFATGNVFMSSFPQPNEFYIGVIDPQISPPLSGLASVTDNYNAIQYLPSPVEFAQSVAHETGHNHGLMHLDCASYQFPPGQSDATFPTHPAGTLESAGWGVLDKIYRPSSTHTDYMAYCMPGWTSAYHWDIVMTNLEALN